MESGESVTPKHKLAVRSGWLTRWQILSAREYVWVVVDCTAKLVVKSGLALCHAEKRVAEVRELAEEHVNRPSNCLRLQERVRCMGLQVEVGLDYTCQCPEQNVILANLRRGHSPQPHLRTLSAQNPPARFSPLMHLSVHGGAQRYVHYILDHLPVSCSKISFIGGSFSSSSGLSMILICGKSLPLQVQVHPYTVLSYAPCLLNCQAVATKFGINTLTYSSSFSSGESVSTTTCVMRGHWHSAFSTQWQRGCPWKLR
eukprot:SAG31_NODE_3506_length_4187_cov_1.703767_3_plen_257_part_00